ncbi:MAG: DUF3365 domain-containing protein [Cytophagaceae bacterium]|nr:DUF3365 domain-containing protein [Cytophagaceae bacterium]
MKLLKSISLILLFTLAACNPDKIDTKQVKEEMKKRKIRKISSGEIYNQAEKTGVKLTDFIQKRISANLQSALQKGGVEAAIPYCIIKDQLFIDSIEKADKLLIRRTTFANKLRNPDNKSDSMQREILDAYLYNTEKGLSLNPDVQIRDNEIIFNTPILIKEQQCLQCHGKPGKDMNDEDYKKILSRYSHDKAIQYKRGDLIGLWTIIFDKKEVVRKIE